eukprot:5504708-Prymnesium_polylepis.1
MCIRDRVWAVAIERQILGQVAPRRPARLVVLDPVAFERLEDTRRRARHDHKRQHEGQREDSLQG